MTEQNYEQLFQDYITICNQALAQHKNIFPYNYLLNSLKDLAPIQVILFDDIPKGRFSLSMGKESIHAKNAGNELSAEPIIRMNISDIIQVVKHPEEYIGQPTKINWAWLRKLAQLSSQG